MELKLNIYKDKKCKEIEKTLVVNDFELSTAICLDVLELVKTDKYDDISALSKESQAVLIMDRVSGEFNSFLDILKDVFDGLTDEDIKKTKAKDITFAITMIIQYSLSTLFSTFGGKNKKK